MKSWRVKETLARRAIEDHGFVVHDANILFGENCPNIDLVVYAQNNASYVQVKSSRNPAVADSVVIDGSPWTEGQLWHDEPIFNKHDHFRCNLVLIVDTQKLSEPDFYITPPKQLERLLLPHAREIAKRPKKDGTTRSIKFRKELPRSVLRKWRRAWDLFGKPLSFMQGIKSPGRSG